MTLARMAFATCLFVALCANGETNYAFRAQLLNVHHPIECVESAPCSSDEVRLDESWTICPRGDSEVVHYAAQDLRDSLKRSYGIALQVGSAGKKSIEVAVGSLTNALMSKIEVSRSRIRLFGATPRECYQCVCWFEDEMRDRRAAIVKIGMRTYTRLFSPRMTHSGYGIDDFPDEYLDQIVHAGMDSVLLFIADPPNVTRKGREDIAGLVARAARRGIDVWAYVYFYRRAAECHPLDPNADAWYDEVYGSIVQNAPGLKGLICVGETCGFPSRDPGMGGFWWQPGWEKHSPRLNGFWPASDWVDWLNQVRRATRQHRKDFEVVFWTYNFIKAPFAERRKLLESLPTDVTLLITWERDYGPVVKLGNQIVASDYTISIPGSGKPFREEAAVAHRRGVPLMTMANTGGRTWDCGVAPYLPSPGLWTQRFVDLRQAGRKWGVHSLMENHHYGFMPNVIASFAKYAFLQETEEDDLDALLRRMAVREYGEVAAPIVLRAWRQWDHALELHQTGDPDFWGPLRIGSSYPLYFAGEKMPAPPEGVRWMYMMNPAQFVDEVLPGEIMLAETEIAYLKNGVRLLRESASLVSPNCRERFNRMVGVGEFCQHAVETLRNVKRFWRASKAGDVVEMRRIVAEERQVALQTLPLVAQDSSLGWEPTMGYVCDERCLQWKLGSLSTLLKRIELLVHHERK